jgi:hypothetical protein
LAAEELKLTNQAYQAHLATDSQAAAEAQPLVTLEAVVVAAQVALE